jgi:hypothetical protein
MFACTVPTRLANSTSWIPMVWSYLPFQWGAYLTKCLKNCGPETALRAARAGLGRSPAKRPDGFTDWIREFSDFFTANGMAIEILANVPHPRDVNSSTIPWISSVSRIDLGNAFDEAEL